MPIILNHSEPQLLHSTEFSYPPHAEAYNLKLYQAPYFPNQPAALILQDYSP